MALFQVTLTIWVLFVLINAALLAGVAYGNELCNDPALSHLSCGWVTKLQSSGVNSTNFNTFNYQNYTDQSNTLFGNFTQVKNQSILNHTGNNDLLDPILDSADIPIYMYWDVIFDIIDVCPVCNTIDALALSLGFDTNGDGVVSDSETPAFRGLTFVIVAGLAITNILAVLYIVGGRSI